jgi:uncharacterized protein (TIGR03435 family)
MSRPIAPQLSFGRKAVLLVAGVPLAVLLAVHGVPQLTAQQTAPVNPPAPRAEEKVAFEVATIKPAAPDAAPKYQMLRPSPDRISIPSMTLTWLIYTAYGEGMNTALPLRGGPEWRNQTAYAIEAKASQPSTLHQVQAMLRTLLEDRFGLKIHIDAETGSFYALVLDRSDGKLGPNVHPWDGTCLNGQAPTEEDDPAYARCLGDLYRPSGLFVDGATMFNGAEMLSLPASRNLLGRVVLDRTGLTGRYRMELKYPFFQARPADPAAPDSRPSLFTVIREQWGMKLEPAQGPFKVIMVDSAHRPTGN